VSRCIDSGCSDEKATSMQYMPYSVVLPEYLIGKWCSTCIGHWLYSKQLEDHAQAFSCNTIADPAALSVSTNDLAAEYPRMASCCLLQPSVYAHRSSFKDDLLIIKLYIQRARNPNFLQLNMDEASTNHHSFPSAMGLGSGQTITVNMIASCFRMQPSHPQRCVGYDLSGGHPLFPAHNIWP
jgi:hypothetical protein